MSTAIAADPFCTPAPSDDNVDDESSAVSSVDESMPGLVYRRVAVPSPSELAQQQQEQQQQPAAPQSIDVLFDPPPPLEPELDDYYDGYSSDGSMPALIPRSQMWSDVSSSSSEDSDSDGIPSLAPARPRVLVGGRSGTVTRADLFDWVLPAYPASSVYVGVGHFRSRGRYDTESDDGCSDGGPRDCDSLEGFRASEHAVKVLEHGDCRDGFGGCDEYHCDGEISEVDDDSEDADDEAGGEEEMPEVKLPAVGDFFPQVEGNPYPILVPDDSARPFPQQNAYIPVDRLFEVFATDDFIRRPVNPALAAHGDRMHGLFEFFAQRDARLEGAVARGMNVLRQAYRAEIHEPEPRPQDPDYFEDLRLQSLRRHERDLQQHQRRQESQRQRRLERRVQRQPRQPRHRHHQMRSHR